MKGLIFLVFLVSGFFEIKSLYEKYEFYRKHSKFMQNTVVGLKPIARLTPASTSHIKKGDPLLKVPGEYIVTTFDSYPWEKYFKNETRELIATALLVSHKLDNSSSVYLNDFFNQYSCEIEPPGYWLEDDLKIWLKKFIEYPNSVRTEFPLYERFKDIAAQIEGIRSLGYEVKTFAWAQAITRTHGIDITKKEWKILRGLPVEEKDSESIGYAFVPLFELYNQYLVPDRFHPESKYPVEYSKDLFTLYSQRDYKPKEEVYVPYRHKGNHELFEDYGVSIPFNTHSTMQINVSEPSSLCVSKGSQCTFYLLPTEISQAYLAHFKDSPNPLLSYRQGVKQGVNNFKFALRHQRRRVKILEDRNLRNIFRLSISEKWTAYKVLALIDRELLKYYIKLLKLVA
jgi:hypothetical protein